MIYNLRVIYALDKSLDGLEAKFSNKLGKLYDDLETTALRQVGRMKESKGKKQIVLPKSKQDGLNNTLKQYFRDVEKVATESVKKELSPHAKTDEQKEKLKDIKAPKSNKVNNVWADKLSERQAGAYLDSVNKAVNEAIKANPDISVNDLKKIVKERTKAFKNTRLDNTVQNESNRIQNEVRLETYRASDMVRAVTFIAVLDNRTTVNCRTKNGTTLKIDDPRLRYYIVPQHPRCRSYLYYVLKDNKKVRLTPAVKVDNQIKNHPVKKLKGMPEVA